MLQNDNKQIELLRHSSGIIYFPTSNGAIASVGMVPSSVCTEVQSVKSDNIINATNKVSSVKSVCSDVIINNDVSLSNAHNNTDDSV